MLHCKIKIHPNAFKTTSFPGELRMLNKSLSRLHNKLSLFGEWSLCQAHTDFICSAEQLECKWWVTGCRSWLFSFSQSWRFGGWLGTGQACLLWCNWLLKRALPAYTFLPGCPPSTAVRLQCWTCLLAPRSPNYEGSGATVARQKGHYRMAQDPNHHHRSNIWEDLCMWISVPW